MSVENVQVVRAASEAFARGDREALARFLDPDEVEWTPLLGALPGVGTLHGRDAVVESLFDIEKYIEGFRIDLDELVDLDDEGVLSLETRHGSPKGTGADITQETGTIFTLRDGLIRSARSFSSKNEALEAAGLSE